MGRFKTEVEFVAAVLTHGAECSIEELRQMREYVDLGSFPALTKLVVFCQDHEIFVTPPLSQGELFDARVFTRLPRKDEYAEAFRSAIDRGECANVEFKQTFFLNVRRRENDRNFSGENAIESGMIHEVVKTITAFMNSGGGTLLIGVCDNGDLYGLETEYQYLPGAKKDKDGWELYFWQTLENCLDEFGRCVGSITGAFVTHGSVDTYVVVVRPVVKRICICRDPGAPGTPEHVYIRNGNRTKKLKMREIEALIIERYSSS